MQWIIYFFEYILSGWIYYIYLIIMLICSLACLGVVGDKVSKKHQAELVVLREKKAEEEYRKAQELVERQAANSGVDMTLDKEASDELKKVQNSLNQELPPSNSATNQVENSTPVVDNTDVESVKGDVPSFLVIDSDDGSKSS